MIRGLRFDPKRGIGLFVILVGVVSMLLALTGTVPSPAVAVIIVALVILLSVAAGFTRSMLFIPPEVATPLRLRCILCSAVCLREANELAAQYYGRDRIQNIVADDWRQKNPWAFVCLLTDDGRVDASFGIMALSPSFMDQFIAGNVTEPQLRPPDILTWEETRRAERLYISGVVVRDAGTTLGHERARILIWSMLKYFRQFFDSHTYRKVYALAATEAGEQLLKRLQFELEVPAEKREDRHNLYAVVLDDQWIRNIEHSFPDYGHLCAFDISEGPGEQTPVAEAARELPSGMLAILFADIADSTALTERLGDAAFGEKARRLDAELRTTITASDGVPVEGNLLGDGVLAVFPSGRQAIQAALHCLGLGEASGLALHLGIHAGDVIREENNVYGGVVNIAARICAISTPGELLVSGTIRDLARSSSGVAFRDRGERDLKGVSDPVRVFEVVQQK